MARTKKQPAYSNRTRVERLARERLGENAVVCKDGNGYIWAKAYDVLVYLGRTYAAAARYLRALAAGDDNATPDGTRVAADDIKTIRALADLTQTQFADLLGVRQQTISEWEVGHYTPCEASARHIVMLAESLGVVRNGDGWKCVGRHEDNIAEGDCR